MTIQDELDELDRRIKILLPEQYEDNYEQVQPVSMGSAGLKFGADGKVQWNDMWATFCDLAMAGGPPHKGALLDAGDGASIAAQPDQYTLVVAEICRGIRLVTGLSVHPSPVDGWIRITCLDAVMAQWLLRAITMENVAARAHDTTLDVPAAPTFRLEKEIKNVITVVAKTCHYWMDHTWDAHQALIAVLFARIDAESPLIEPTRSGDVTSDRRDRSARMMADALRRQLGRPVIADRYYGWMGLECPTVAEAVWMMRALVTANVLSRREGTILFVPINPDADADGTRVVSAVTRVHTLLRQRVKD